MKINLKELLLQSNGGYYSSSARYSRLSLVSAFVIYSLFGIVDKFMLPETYHYAWIIRYLFIVPGLAICYAFTYHPKFRQYNKQVFTFLVLLGQFGIVAIMFFAVPAEHGYFSYYVGLILVILWAVLVFRLSIPEIVFSAITNVIFYNALALFVQKLHTYSVHSKEFTYLVNNNFFLISTSLLAILGAALINYYKNKIKAQNRILAKDRQELIKAKKKAEESDRLKSMFLANISHEIRSPMNAIMGFSEILKHPNTDEAKRERYIGIIQTKGNELLRLITDIIDLSRIEANYLNINPKQLNLNEIMDELLFNYQRVINEKDKSEAVILSVNKQLPNNKSIIKIDGLRLQQILSNLIENAIKFTDSGKIVFGYYIKEENQLNFYVEDTGIGISEQHIGYIFENFRQADKNISTNYGGTGLGLSIVKKLVELMNGTIQVKSEENIGTVFNISLPFLPVKEKVT